MPETYGASCRCALCVVEPPPPPPPLLLLLPWPL